MILNCVTVDDEPLALGLINRFIQQTPFLKLKASYSKASEALQGIERPGIHLVFLDIQMPKHTGIDIARAINTHTDVPPPRVIFTTAYNQFAMESYQVEALDYLLKPFGYDDFLRAVNKGVRFFENTGIENKPATEEALYVKTGHQQVKISLDNISYIKGLRDYALIHLKDGAAPVITLNTLKLLLSRLPANRFMRVQRSFIVALDGVTSVSANTLFISGLEINIGEQYRKTVRDYFEQLL